MVNAEQFVAGRGGFSEMALHVRQLRNSTSIADPELSGYVLGGRASPTDLGGVEHEPAGGLSTAPAMGRLSRVGLGLAIMVNLYTVKKSSYIKINYPPGVWLYDESWPHRLLYLAATTKSGTVGSWVGSTVL